MHRNILLSAKTQIQSMSGDDSRANCGFCCGSRCGAIYFSCQGEVYGRFIRTGFSQSFTQVAAWMKLFLLGETSPNKLYFMSVAMDKSNSIALSSCRSLPSTRCDIFLRSQSIISERQFSRSLLFHRTDRIGASSAVSL